jgi:hypothetical protein
MFEKRLRIFICLLVVTFFNVPHLHALQQPAIPTKAVTIILPANSNPRILYGVEKLSKTLTDAGYVIKKLSPDKIASATKPLIIVATVDDDLIKQAATIFKININKKAGKEGFTIILQIKM